MRQLNGVVRRVSSALITRKHIQVLVSLLLLLCLAPAVTLATPDYAKQTGFECGKCHRDAIGGGQLTEAGEHYLRDLQAKGQYRTLSTTQHLIRLAVGYLHMMAGIVWFGTIMYVHILLKPAYASKGLPKGELRLGWISMIVITVTGILLTVARMPSLESFVNTRFGILLTIKIFFFLLMLGSALVVTIYIGPKLRQKLKSPVAAVCSNDITREQLAQFDGQEGRPAYFAYKGMVYDVTNNRLWKRGAHMMKHHAGTDLTDALATAPHGEDKIMAMTQVGIVLATGARPVIPFHERLFYYFAYMNLMLVFVIIFVISLWRWW